MRTLQTDRNNEASKYAYILEREF